MPLKNVIPLYEVLTEQNKNTENPTSKKLILKV